RRRRSSWSSPATSSPFPEHFRTVLELTRDLALKLRLLVRPTPSSGSGKCGWSGHCRDGMSVEVDAVRPRLNAGSLTWRGPGADASTQEDRDLPTRAGFAALHA